MVSINVDTDRITGQELPPALAPATRSHLIRQAVDSETLELVGLAAIVAAIGAGAITPGQLALEGLVDAIVGDTGGDIAFSRNGRGAASDLRGAIRAGAVNTTELAAAVVSRLFPASSPVTAFWSGTQAQYNAISSKSASTLYLVDA